MYRSIVVWTAANRHKRERIPPIPGRTVGDIFTCLQNGRKPTELPGGQDLTVWAPGWRQLETYAGRERERNGLFDVDWKGNGNGAGATVMRSRYDWVSLHTCCRHSTCRLALERGNPLCGVSVAKHWEESRRADARVVWFNSSDPRAGRRETLLGEHAGLVLVYFPSLETARRCLLALKKHVRVPVTAWTSSECGAEHGWCKSCSVLRGRHGVVTAKAVERYGRGLCVVILLFYPECGLRGQVSRVEILRHIGSYFDREYAVLRRDGLFLNGLGVKDLPPFSIELVPVKQRKEWWQCQRERVVNGCSEEFIVPGGYREQPPPYEKWEQTEAQRGDVMTEKKENGKCNVW